MQAGNDPEGKIEIDGAETNGLLGVENSLAYRVNEIERHLHHNEKWFGLASIPNGEIHRADEMTLMPAPFLLDAGNNTWGSWVQLLGSSDTPFVSGQKYFDFHEFLVVDHERNVSLYTIQLVYGESADISSKLSAGNYNTIPFITPSAPGGQNEPLSFNSRRISAGQKVWGRIWCRGQNTAELYIYIGLHEYEG